MLDVPVRRALCFAAARALGGTVSPPSCAPAPAVIATPAAVPPRLRNRRLDTAAWNGAGVLWSVLTSMTATSFQQCPEPTARWPDRRLVSEGHGGSLNFQFVIAVVRVRRTDDRADHVHLPRVRGRLEVRVVVLDDGEQVGVLIDVHA
jgi:hypothetical protein